MILAFVRIYIQPLKKVEPIQPLKKVEPNFQKRLSQIFNLSTFLNGAQPFPKVDLAQPFPKVDFFKG